MGNSYDSKTSRERTQLFANVRPYSPAQMADVSSSVDASNPYANAALRGSRGPQFTDAMYDQLESQHDEQFNVLSSKISVLKDLTSRIGGEVIDGNGMLAKLENRFDGARVSVRNTMHRMTRTADQYGVGWRSLLALFGIIILCFWFVMFF